MIFSCYRRWIFILAGWMSIPATPVTSQDIHGVGDFYPPDPRQRVFDSIVASRIPVIKLPADAFIQTLPESLDNSSYMWFPGILDQEGFFSCQQYSGTAYTFAYEINRLRNTDGKIPENKYPPHYMWHFFNQGERYVGVNFLHTFHAMMEQGHMTNADFGSDTGQMERGWITGYDKYYRSMKNRIRNIYAIPVNSAEGIQTVKQYLFDHLDGSSTGGIACFTSSSPNFLPQLPAGTPEAGKEVLINWQPYATHGMTIVGYHDSIRYDLNSDGQYTNDIDINEDSIVDARDWEIGGFRLANSYGTWWSDQGYFYVLYHAMASPFEQGGVWNNCVYIVEPDPGYSPLLTLKIDLEHNLRNQLNILAGVSSDLLADYPDHVYQPILFSNQGGPYYMQGFDSLPDQKRLEFGIDVTPLLSFVEPGIPARFFLIIEERDPSNTGQGIVHEASFIHYDASAHFFPCSSIDVPVNHQGTTILSATGSANFDLPVILNEELPPFTSSGNYQVEFQSQGGESPYIWSLHQPYQKMTGGATYTPFTDQLLVPQSSGKPYATVALPFSFPFSGNSYDTLFVNATGMIHFTDEHLPYPYLCSATDMFNYSPAISPAFSWDFTMQQSGGDGMWMSSSPDSVRFRWQLSIEGEETQTMVEFGVTLFPDGKLTFCYGTAGLGQTNLIAWGGISAEERQNNVIYPIFDLNAESGNSYTWIPPAIPGAVTMSPEGLLTISGADTNTIYDLPVRVTDMQGIFADKHFQLSSGLIIRHALSGNSGHLQQAEPASLDLELTNITPLQMGEVTLKLFFETPGLVVTDSLASIATVDAGQSADLSTAFSFILQAELPDQTSIPCRIEAISDGKSWEYCFFLHVSAVDLQVTGMELQDGVNALLDAGETADLVFTLSNRGSLPASGLNITLSSEDDFFEILSSPTLSAGTMGQKEMYNAVFTVRSSKNTPPGHPAPLELVVTYDPDAELVHPCTISMGTRPVALINLASVTTTVALMAHLMDSLQLGYDSYTSLPENLSVYPAAFIILGTAYPGSNSLSLDETNQLIGYLLDGGNVYMESYASWYYGTSELLEDLFRFSTARVSVYYFDTVVGVDGTMTGGMDYLYTGSSPYAIFEVIPDEEGFSLMKSTGDPSRCLEFAYAGEEYKTIGTFKEFGELVDGEPPSQKAILFKGYLDFLEINIDGPFPFFHADTTHICRWHTVHFTDDSFEDVISWQWEFPGGTPAASEEQNPIVNYTESGSFDVILTISDGTHTQQLHKKKYIQVNVCSGMEEKPVASDGIRIFPNPARTSVHLVVPETLKEPVLIDFIDLRGSVVSHASLSCLPGNIEFPVDISALPAGIYVVRVIGEKVLFSKKLVIY